MYIKYILYIYILHISCIFMDELETEFLKSQELKPFLWLCYNDDVFFT